MSNSIFLKKLPISFIDNKATCFILAEQRTKTKKTAISKFLARLFKKLNQHKK
jgi:hypothetical protein